MKISVANPFDSASKRMSKQTSDSILQPHIHKSPLYSDGQEINAGFLFRRKRTSTNRRAQWGTEINSGMYCNMLLRFKQTLKDKQVGKTRMG
ncbi:hypothetical protein TNCT_326071 [Trichonephila clavata]|uniref:Uncharacterized protein n=1 Tax=Trichonephila clavata TaxID=2740835 RepID=A0A8X6JQ15_TRICU|nr:hypothetical protein TNCT_326071 [Trichonephila clavata]